MSELVIANKNLEPLSMEQLRKRCPAVFATAAHEDVSARYGFASTAQVLQALEKEGYVPVEARSYNRRDEDRMQFTKHMIRLRRKGDVNKLLLNVGDVVPQSVLINSHDRSSNFQLYAGMFRKACSNGLIVSDKSIIEPLRVRHTNRIIEDIMSNIDRIAKDAGKVSDIIERMTKTKLTEKQQRAFAGDALALRMGNGTKRGSLEPVELLKPRRAGDEGPSVWNVYNRVQENLIRGGLPTVTANGRHTTTKEIVAVNADISINAGLWELAMATINKAKA